MNVRAHAVSLCLLLLVSSAAAQEPPQVVYTPPPRLEDAQKSAQEFTKQPEAKRQFRFFLARLPLSVGSDRSYVDWSWGDDAITVRTLRGPGVQEKFGYRAMPAIGVISDTVLGAPFYGVRLDAEWVVWADPIDSDYKLPLAKWLADMFALRLAILTGREAFEQAFREALNQYPSGSTRPPLPEGARRFKVMAESAVAGKDVPLATQNYIEALKVAPWWAEGYFNVALLYSEMKAYDGAIRNMRRFLLLEPTHAKARQAQDQIYAWESLLQQAKR